MLRSTEGRNQRLEAKVSPREEGQRSVHWLRQSPEEIDQYS